MEAIAGDIVWGRFDYEEGSTEDLHPLLVLEVLGYGIRVAYGTSQRATPGATLANELLLDKAEAQACGLSRATRFELHRRQLMPLDLSDPAWAENPIVGNIRKAGSPAMHRLIKAAKAAGFD
jgi:hypothetical protein